MKSKSNSNSDRIDLAKWLTESETDAFYDRRKVAKKSDYPNFIRHLVEIRNLCAMTKIGHRVALYEALRSAALVSNHISQNDAAWEAFCRAGMVSKALTNRDRPKALRWSVEAATGCDAKQASDYVRAITALQAQGVAPEDIADQLPAEGGVKALIAAYPKRGGARATPVSVAAKSEKSSDGQVSWPVVLRFEPGIRTLADVPTGKKLRLACVLESVGPSPVLRVTARKVLD